MVIYKIPLSYLKCYSSHSLFGIKPIIELNIQFLGFVNISILQLKGPRKHRFHLKKTRN